jgi:hypothetical protein
VSAWGGAVDDENAKLEAAVEVVSAAEEVIRVLHAETRDDIDFSRLHAALEAFKSVPKIVDEAAVGETTVSVQHRCEQMEVHAPGPAQKPIPCESCYSLVTTSVRIPYRRYMPFTKVVPWEGE